jgi:rubrerythrin
MNHEVQEDRMANTKTEAQIVAELNDLLQLDHDAVQAYGLAIEGIERPEYREALTRFRGDHERHVRNLTELIEAHGGEPIQLSHLPTGPMKLAVQALGNLGDDREVLLAFKSNERQVRDKYQRLADDMNSPDVAEVLNRNAADEEKHYAWAARELERMGAGPDTGIGRGAEAFETVHSRAADAIEGAERAMMSGVERIRRSPVAALLLGAASVLLLRRIFR